MRVTVAFNGPSISTVGTAPFWDAFTARVRKPDAILGGAVQAWIVKKRHRHTLEVTHETARFVCNVGVRCFGDDDHGPRPRAKRGSLHRLHLHGRHFRLGRKWRPGLHGRHRLFLRRAGGFRPLFRCARYRPGPPQLSGDLSRFELRKQRGNIEFDRHHLVRGTLIEPTGQCGKKKPPSFDGGFRLKPLAVSYSCMANAKLPSALVRFTSEFGMGSGGTTP